MAGIVKEFAGKFAEALETRLVFSKQNCKASLEGSPSPRTVIDLDNPKLELSGHALRCDFLYVAERYGEEGLVVPIELKKGAFDTGKIVSQLQAGADFAERHLPKGAAPEFIPVAFTGKGPKGGKNELKKGDNLVKFKGVGASVRRRRCGDSLVSALRN